MRPRKGKIRPPHPPERTFLRFNSPIAARMRMLRAFSLKPKRRALLAPFGLRLSWQIVRDRRQVRARCCRSNRMYDLLRR